MSTTTTYAQVVLEPASQAFVEATAAPPYLYDLTPDQARKVLDEVQSAPIDKLPVDERPARAEGTLPVGPARRWIVREGAAHGLDPGRMAIAGASVGGGMTAAITLVLGLLLPRRRAARRAVRLAHAGRRRAARRACAALLIVAEADVLRDKGEAHAGLASSPAHLLRPPPPPPKESRMRTAPPDEPLGLDPLSPLPSRDPRWLIPAQYSPPDPLALDPLSPGDSGAAPVDAHGNDSEHKCA
jgi:hypothetical protein